MKSFRGSLWLAFGNKYTGLLIHFVSTLVVARLLTPEDIGVFSVAAALVTVAHTLRDFGVGQYLIQEKELTEQRIRTAFGLTLVMAWGLALALVALSATIADFFGNRGIQAVIYVMAGNFLLIPFGSTVLSLLNRNLEFGQIYVIGTSSRLVSALVVTLLAYLGFGYMSMAWSAMAGVIATVILTNIYRPAGLPLLPAFGEYRRVLSFGGKATVATVARDMEFGSADVIVGRAIGLEALGFFGRALGLCQVFDRMVMQALRLVFLPHLAAMNREGQSVKGAYITTVTLLTGAGWPFFAFIAIMAYPLVRILYGDQWDASIPLVGILCGYTAATLPFYFNYQVFVALGAVDRYLKFQIVSLLVTVTAILAGLPHGLAGVAIALCASAMVVAVVSYLMLRLLLSLSLAELLAATWRSVGVTAASALLPAIAASVMRVGPQDVWLPLLAGGAGGLAGWIAGLWIFRHPFRLELARVVRFLRDRARARGGR